MSNRDFIVDYLVASEACDREEAEAFVATLDVSALDQLRVALEGALNVSCGITASIRVFDKDGNDITSR